LDLAAGTDDPIIAADTGTVIYSGWNDWGYGNLVILDHANGYQTLYAHLDVVKVSCGQNVHQGDLIGLAGMTGHTTTGPHLHFEVILHGAHVNPWSVLPPP
jgi:murein DD-endopeptidase MepM/ murein hydrolase activator NlpD